MKVIRGIGIAFVVLFLSALVGVSVLLLSKNKYGFIELGDSLLLTINADNKSAVYEAGSLVVLNKVKSSDLEVGEEVFVYEQTEDLNSIFVVSVKIVGINENEEYITTDKDGKNWSFDYIAGTSNKMIPNLGTYIDLVTSKWFIFVVFLVPTFFILIYQVYLIVINVKYDDDDIDVGDTPEDTAPEDEIARLRKELEALQQKALEKTGKLPVTSLDLPKEAEAKEEQAPEQEETPKEDVVIELPKELDVEEEISNLTIDNPGADAYTPESLPGDGPVSKDMIQSAIDQFMIQNGIIALDEAKKEEKGIELPKRIDGGDPWEDIEDDTVQNADELPEDEPQEQEDEGLDPEATAVGKNESNVLKKGVLLLQNQVKELLRLLVNIEKEKKGYTKAIDQVATHYIEDKYYGETYLTGDMHYKNSLIDAYRFNELPSNTKKFVELTNDLKCINTILYRPTKKGIETAVERYKSNLSDEKKDKLCQKIEESIKRYNDLEKDFFLKIHNKNFELIQEPIEGGQFMITYVKVDIQFDKIFSEYAIDKSYQNKIIAENLDEMQLKMIGFQLFENIIKNKNETTRYLFHFSETMFAKERKISTLLNGMSDPYQQEKIIITLTKETLAEQIETIKEYRKNGYQFGVCIKAKDLNKTLNKKELVFADYIFIYDEENTGVTEAQKEEFLPINAKDRIFVSNIPVLHEEAHK